MKVAIIAMIAIASPLFKLLTGDPQALILYWMMAMPLG
jgi:hypothetical protein